MYFTKKFGSSITCWLLVLLIVILTILMKLSALGVVPGIPSYTRENVANQSMYSCDPGSECWKFRNFLQKELEPKKPKAAVYILSRARDANDLQRTLTELEKNLLSNYSYPVIIFYEKDFFPLIPVIRKCTKANLFFQEVQFKLPTFLYPLVGRGFECTRFNIGYKHMCRFHAKTVFELPIMRNLEYYIRLDAHSYITKPVPYDIFQHMRDNDILYGYPCIAAERGSCVRFLWDAVDVFIKLRRLKPQFYSKMTGFKMFYNNFEVARMDVFTSLPYQNYINFIDQMGGTFYNRWGDAPIKSLGVSIFVPENKTKHFYDIDYFHRRQHLTKGLSRKPAHNRCRR